LTIRGEGDLQHPDVIANAIATSREVHDLSFAPGTRLAFGREQEGFPLLLLYLIRFHALFCHIWRFFSTLELLH
jgi:hypothetical protein